MMREFKCTSSHATKTKAESWLPFAQLVTVGMDNVPFDMKGVHSKNSVMVVPFRVLNGERYVGIIKEQRPLFCGDQWLSAFPAGKIEDDQSPEDAARLESLQEGGIVIKNLNSFRNDMPFLHICDEQVFLFTAELERESKQQLEEGEFIKKLTWIPWKEFKERIRRQQIDGTPLLEDAPMMGVSLSSANKLIVLGF